MKFSLNKRVRSVFPKVEKHCVNQYKYLGIVLDTELSDDKDIQWQYGNGLLFQMTQPTSRTTIKAIASSKPTISEH